MAKTKSTKHALLVSGLALLLCLSMLIGSTFAWFTDTVTSAGNIIKSGNLDVTLSWADGTADPDTVSWTDASSSAIFNYDNWEPGYAVVRHIKIGNEGTLALKYMLNIVANGAVSELADVIDVYYADPAVQVTSRDALNDNMKLGTLTNVLAGMSDTASGNLEAGAEDVITIALKMQESAGNEYQNKSIGSDFSVQLFASQYTSESDSFGSDYDLTANLPGEASGQPGQGASSVPVEIRDAAGTKLGSAEVPTAAIENGEAGSINVKITEKNEVPEGVTVQVGEEAVAYDIQVEGLKEDNTTPIKISLNLQAGLNPATVKVYHYGNLIDSSYNPTTGLVTFESATFSPFTIVYDAESTYVPPVADESKLPTATVTEYTNTANIKWGNYGQWSPTEGLEANLDAAYTFSCTETSEQAATNPYAYWNCDFYVMLDKDLGENEIFLGGNYGSFGWVGFHNGDVTLNANEEIGLLESVTTNHWTYMDVVDFVGEFICGVGDVNDALATKDATFTVMLRLTNPDDKTDFVNVATITYNFATGESTLTTAK